MSTKRNPVSTFVIIGVNAIVFAWLAFQQHSFMMDTNADVLAILFAGANLNPFTLGGEPWRIVTSMFLHFGIIHLAVNMYGLYNLGKLLEPTLGTPRFLFVYFICGVASGLASLIFNVYTISAGASGAIFGLYGYVLVAEVLGSLHDREKLQSVIINFVIFVVINAYITSQFQVDLSGHIGGCLAGIVLAILHFKLRLLTNIKQLAFVLIVLPFIMIALPKDQLQYYRIFQNVLSTDDKTNIVFRNTKSDEQLKDSLKAVVLPQWDSIQASLKSLAHVPAKLTADTTILHKYIRLRRLQTMYHITMIERESYVYMDSLDWVNNQFDSIPHLQFTLNYKVQQNDLAPIDTTSVKPVPLIPIKVFYDKDWKEIDEPLSAMFFRIGTRDTLNRWQGIVRDYYRSGKVQMKGKYRDGIKQGVFLYYSDRDTYESAGRYEKGRAINKWENYHWNGALKSEIFYNNGAYNRNVWDSLGNIQVKNGEGKVTTWYANGKVKEEGNIVAGMREDFWHGFHPDGEPYYEELYIHNRLVRGIAIAKDGKRYVYDQLSEFPLPVTGMIAYKKYLSQNLRSANLTPAANGIVEVVFNVSKDGTLSDFEIMQSVCQQCDQEAIRLIQDGPAWKPGLLYGHIKIQSQGYVEVEF